MTTYSEFWTILTLGATDPAEFRRELEQLSEADLVDLHDKYEEAVADLKTDEFTRNIPLPYSEDTLDDLAKHVVEQGLDAYEQVCEDPSTFPREVPRDARPGTLGGIVLRVYRDRFGCSPRSPDGPPPGTAT